MKRRIVWINLALVLVIVAAGVGGYLWLFAPEETVSTGRTVSVQTGTVSETVTATGTVETAGTVELSFADGGTVAKVKVAQGDIVRAGKALVTVDDAAARGSLDAAQSSYVQAATGVQKSSLSLTAAQQSVRDAQTSAELDKSGYEQSVQQARKALNDSKSSWADSCLDPAGTCPDASIWSQLRSAEAEVTSAKTAYEQAVQTASEQETTNNLKLNQAKVNGDEAKSKQDTACNTYGSSATQCTTAVDATRSTEQQYELLANSNSTAAVQSQQSLVNADARITSANISLKKLQATLANQAQDSVTAAEQVLASATLAQEKGLAAGQQSIRRAQESLASLQASSASIDVGVDSLTAEQAAVDIARAGLTQARQAVVDTTLRAPVAGTIASVDATVGTSAPAGTTMVTLIPDAAYQIVANFSEADAMKVAVDQVATVTFDALTDGAATGTVTAVDILPTTGSNVTTYGATITLSDVPDGLRDGMSASVVVTVDEVTDVLWAPTAAITTAGGQSTVTVRADGVETTVQVTTGLVGDTGTEILTGVSDGDQLVVSTTDSSSSSGFPMGGIPGGGRTVGGPPAGGPAS